MDNNTQKQKEQQHALFKGILNALTTLNGNLTAEGETEGETVPAIGAIAESLDSIATSLGAISTTLGTIAEKLDPLYTADYTAPEEETPSDPSDPSDPEEQTEPSEP